MTPEDLEAQSLADTIQENVWLVMLHVGWPQLTHKLKDAEVFIKLDAAERQQVDEKLISKPNLTLMPDEWKKALRASEQQARAALYEVSTRAGFGGGWGFVPIAKARELFTQLNRIRDEFGVLADKFAAYYSELLLNLRRDLGDQLYDRIVKKLPAPTDIRSRFSVRWGVLPLGGKNRLPTETWNELIDKAANGDRDSLVDRLTELRDKQHILEEGETDLVIEEAKQLLPQMLQQAVQDMIRTPRDQVQEACNTVISAIHEDRPVREASMQKLQRAFEYMESFAFLVPEDVRDRLTAVRNRMSSAESLRRDRSGALELAGAMQTLVGAITNPEYEEQARARVPGVRRIRMG